MRRSLLPHGDDVGVVGRTFDAAIRAQVEVRSVAIVLAVGLVVLALVADEIGEREPVVHGHVVDARARRAAMMLEDVGGAGHPRRHFADQAALAGPVAAQRRGGTHRSIPTIPAETRRRGSRRARCPTARR